MNLGSILKTVGEAALSTTPLGAAVVGAVNMFLPDDKKLSTASTGTQAQQAIQSLSPELQERLMEAELADKQAEQHETQTTIRAGDANADPFVRRTRPLYGWISLIGCMMYVGYQTVIGSPINGGIVSSLLTLPMVYMGLRQLDKGVGSNQWFGKK